MGRVMTPGRDNIIAVFITTCLAGGCGVLPGLPAGVDAVSGALAEQPVGLTADVTAVDQISGLPTRLSGVLSGGATGTYVEEILEVYFDGAGAPIAAISRSTMNFDAPKAGTLITMNLIVVSKLIIVTDESGLPILDALGQPVVSGMSTAATGHVIFCDGMWEGTSGQLSSDSTLLFGKGAAGLGLLDSQLNLKLDTSSDMALDDLPWSGAVEAF